jgi:hypothetical protein
VTALHLVGQLGCWFVSVGHLIGLAVVPGMMQLSDHKRMNSVERTTPPVPLTGGVQSGETIHRLSHMLIFQPTFDTPIMPTPCPVVNRD